jgi:glycosyltransferase involved in cell wall biosynthesis
MVALVAGQPPRPAGLVFLWCHETWLAPYETGIQRVVRRLADNFARHGLEVIPVGWDWGTRRVKALGPGAMRGAQALEDASRRHERPSWLLVPELGMDLAAEDLDAAQIGHAYGLEVAALVHDLIPLKRAQDYSDAFRARFDRYIASFATADLVVTTTRYVAADLLSHLTRAGLAVPKLVTVPLPAQFAGRPRRLAAKPARAPGAPLRLVTVSTWEPRKNLPRLLTAIRQAQARSAPPIELVVVGRRAHFADYDAEVERLCADMAGVTLKGAVSDDALAGLYDRSDASVYPSVEEGFGLPIGESLWLATPCLCHSGSAMAEVAPGGGTLMVDMTDEAAIAGALHDFAADPALLARLSAEAVARSLASWSDYARDIARWTLQAGST